MDILEARNRIHIYLRHTNEIMIVYLMKASEFWPINPYTGPIFTDVIVLTHAAGINLLKVNNGNTRTM